MGRPGNDEGSNSLVKWEEKYEGPFVRATVIIADPVEEKQVENLAHEDLRLQYVDQNDVQKALQKDMKEKQAKKRRQYL